MGDAGVLFQLQGMASVPWELLPLIPMGIIAGLLAGLLGCPWVRNKAVWNKLSGLMTRVTVDTVNLEHSLLTGGSSSIAVMELSADAQQNLYPAKWIHNGLAAALITRSHTDGALPPSATKTAVKSKRLLRRHKSI